MMLSKVLKMQQDVEDRKMKLLLKA
jgi:hypothetical protein